MTGNPQADVTGAILAGGRGKRMGGHDKGMVILNEKPMIDYVMNALRPQVSTVVINANRNHEFYRQYGCPVIADNLSGFQGPLAGMASCLVNCITPYVATVPCDSPLLPADLVARLYVALAQNHAEISVAHDGNRMQPVFCLLHRSLIDSLSCFLREGERKIDRWFARHKVATVDFSSQPDTFLNINTPADRDALEVKLSH